MENNKEIQTAEQLKSAAIGFIGAGIFSQGTLYFQPQSNYNIPRILYPVFIYLGNTGLAVTMVLLGLALLFFGLKKWMGHGGKIGLYALVSLASLALFFSILIFTGKKKTSTEELVKTSEENRQKGIEKINAMEKPDFGNPEVDQHFASFEILLQEYSTAFKNKSKAEIAAKEKAYMDWSSKSAGLIQKLNTPEQKQQFALYLAKLSMKWQEVK
ncbi:hypothetical protein ASE92_06010 [Pedobacter sp. Leaf41]|uniref:hypothetical protein n=1 Tax=Pedobacter sp. Leaf41 TaxID=1736218 RepID=UPI000702EAFF|nr:hypothetical protein [Pedobacter sp. Leaf41]KQN38967.1 hypothetical protein ASE92_06010 [Pedobacter sp. Leaf41]